MQPRPTRRQALGAGLLAGLGLADPLALRARAQDVAAAPRARGEIHLHLGGGLAHQETLDPKPYAPAATPSTNGSRANAGRPTAPRPWRRSTSARWSCSTRPLAWGSPAIDSGAFGSGFDRDSHLRAVDGDLDLVSAPDMGAFEHQTLAGPSSVEIGELFDLDVPGPVGGFTTVVVSLAGYAPSGSPTPFGRYFLDPGAAYRLMSVPTLGPVAARVQVPAFTDPALSGTDVGLQALTRSAAAPAGGAFTPPILIRVEPMGS